MTGSTNERVDVLVVGGGLMGAAVAQQVREGAPSARILMVDAGRQIGGVRGQHLHDVAEPEVRAEYLRSAAPGIQSLYLGAEPTPTITPPLSEVTPGMYNLSAFGAETTQMPGSAWGWNAGGMGVHWAAATPSPWGSEVFAGDDAYDWSDELDEARRLLHVSAAPFEVTAAGAAVLDVLQTLYGPTSADGRHPQPMPMAVTPAASGPLHRTGPNRVFPRMRYADGEDFALASATVAVALDHDGGRVRGARLRNIETGREYSVEAGVTVVAADPIRTPQLLHASGIRPDALGRNLNEHAFLTGQVLVDTARWGIDLNAIPVPRDGEWLVDSLWVPHSGSDQPFHGQVMTKLFLDEQGSRLAYAAGLSWYVPTEPDAANRLRFDDDLDATGMPRVRIEFRRSAADDALIEVARESQRRAGEALGDFEPARDSALLPPGSSLHFTGTARSGGADDGESVCDARGRVWGFTNLYLVGGAVVPTAVVGNSTLTATVTAVRTAREIVRRRE
jgi:choline dehydrogenase-like flavoprotein